MASLCALVWQTARMQSPLRRITSTNEEGTSINPAMSGDGRIIAFESTEDIAGAGGFESFRAIRSNVGVDPPTFLQMAPTRAPAPAISQDGSHIAFASKDNPLGTNNDANSEIFLYDGARLLQITNTSPGDIANRVVNGNFLPSISDDGRYVAFSSNRDLASQNADGNLEIFIFDSVALSFTQLTNSSGIVGFSDAKISGNGDLVAYIRDSGTTPSLNRDLLLQSRDGASPARLVAIDVQSLAMTHGRAISDDGARVVWAAETATNSTQVFLFDGRSNTTRQITSLGSRATDVPLHPTISGDGSRIAFATRRSFLGNSDGSVDLYSFDIPSATFARVTSGPSTATAEVVSSLNDDGSLIAFNFPRVLSGISNTDFANNSEIYVTATPLRPAFGTLTILNGASFGNEPSTTEAVAPDSIAVARGSVLANTTARSQPLANGDFPQTLGGTTVTVNGRRAQIFSVSGTQVNFLVPPETELGAAEVIVTNSDGFASRGTVSTLRAAPGVFTSSGDGLGDGVILDENTLQPAPFDPTAGNLRLIVFATGIRPNIPIINASQVSLTAGGRALTLESIVASPTMPGLDEVHVLVPADLRGAGKVDLVINADGRDSNPATVNFIGEAKRDIVINEFLADPPDGASGDANRDGVRNTSDDEFVELVNTTTHDIDMSGYQILTRGTGAADTVRHTFVQGASAAILPACTAIVIFGGGNPSADNSAFGGAQLVKASTGSLTLINSAGVITLHDQAGAIVSFVTYGGATGLDGNANQSLTRSPDITGAFTLHQSAGGSGGPGGLLFSPGTRVDGTAFTPCPSIARVEVSPSSATVEVGGQQQFTARAFDDGGNAVAGVIFSWQSSDTSTATIDQHGRATALSARGAGGAGSTIQIRATGRGVQSAPAMLTVNPPAPILTSVTISPASATTRVGEAQQFTAQANDQFGQNIGGVTISFSSSNTGVAAVDSVTATSASGSATATLTGRASGPAQITATANNGSADVTSSPATLTVEPGVGQLLISEFRTRGPNGASDEFIELYNPTLSTVTIGGLKIRASNSTGSVSDRITIPAATTLLSGRHYLVANNTANTGYGGAVAANQTYATGIADDGGIGITGSNGATIIDSVGMSSGSGFKEGTTLAPLNNNVNQSYERKPGGASGNGLDTNNNSSDFFLNNGNSNPQNLDSAGLDLNTADLSVSNTDSPDPVITGSDVTYTIAVTNSGPGTAQSVVLTDNLPASVTFVSCSCTGGGACGGTGNNRIISFSSLLSGSYATITLVATANGAAGTTIANTTTATSATSDRIPGNNSTTATTNVQAPPSLLSISDVAANEGNGGTTTFVFTVNSSSPAPAGGITFDLATADGTAQDHNPAGEDNDYVSRILTGQTIPAGLQTYTFDVTVNGDLLVEPNETFFVNVTNVSGATLADGQGQGTIQNDDTANLVISQVYAGGGNSGALYTNDFVELFNRGTTTVNFAATPYSVQYAGATANFGSNKVELTSGTIAPGKYFLVQLSSGGANGAALPTADANGSINLAATAGKVSLVVGTASLPVSTCPGDDGVTPFNPNNANLADFIGYGTSAICHEGPIGPAPAPSATAADFREAGGCTDSDDNATDFLIAAPAPRNTSSPTNDCSAPPLPTLTINDVSGLEGNGGAVTFTFSFRVALSTPAPAGGVSFDIATQDNTATAADGDYVPQTLTSQTIPAGNSAYTFDVTVNGDLNIESDETFFVNVANVSRATIADGQGQGTIQNDDIPELTINDVSANETNSGTTTFTFTVTSSLPAPAAGITFDIATTDVTAQDDNPVSEDNDYVTSNLTRQTILAGQQTYTFNVTVNGDTVVESDETFLVNVSNVSNASVLDGQGQGTIRNDDLVTRIDVLPSSATINRGNTLQFSATAFDPSHQANPAAGFTWQSSNTAVATINPNGLATGAGIGTTTITATTANGTDGIVSATATLTVQLPLLINEALAQVPLDSAATPAIEGDANRDGVRNSDDDEFVELLNNSTAAVDISGVVISDSTSKRFTFPANTMLSAGRAAVVFGGGAPPVNDPAFGGALIFTTSSLGLGDGGDIITIKLPVAGSDVLIDSIAYGTGNPTPAPGAQSLTRSPDADTGSAGGGFVIHTTATNAAGRVFSPGTRADGTPFGSPAISRIEVLPAVAAINIGASQLFTAQAYSNAGGPEIEVLNVSFIWDSNDTGKATVAPATGRTTTARTVAAGGPAIRARAGGQQGAATLTVNPPPPALTINDVSAAEGNAGTKNFTFTVSLSAPAPTGGVSFDIATADASAEDGNPGSEDHDYVSRSLTAQTIPAGSMSYTFDVAVNGDLNIESNETFVVDVTNVAGAMIADAQGVGTIQNDDNPTLTINDVSASEGNAGTLIFTFTVSSSLPAPGSGVTFDLATADGTAQDHNPASEDNDYVARILTAQTIPAGLQTYTFDVTVNGDLLVEPNETFFVNVTNVSGATLADGQGEGTIQNDDTAHLVISQVYAGGGNSGAHYTHDFVELLNRGTTAVNFATTPYSVQYAGATANFGANKIDLSSGAIAPGKYFLVQLSSGGANGAALPAADATGSINMAATAGKITLVVGTTALNAASCPLGAAVSDFVGYGPTANCFEGSNPAPAQASAANADLRKAGGCIDTNENAADFLVSAPFPRHSSSAANNCAADVPPNLTVDDVTVTEGNSGTTAATFTVSLSAPAPSTDITFDIATQNNTATTANTDYVAKTLTSQIIPAGRQTYVFTVTVNGDVAIENDETFFVSVTNVSGATLLDGQGVGTIQNDDLPALSINDVTSTEGNSGTKLFTFKVSLSAVAPTGGVTFDIATADGTAQDGNPVGEDNDYVARSLATQTIPAGSQNYSLDVMVYGDLSIEANETFFVNITNVSGATVTDNQGLGTIQNDDSPTLTINDVSANETNSGTTTFTFTVTSSLPAPPSGITFDIATVDGTAQDDNPATEDNDYVAKSLTAQTITAGNTTSTFQVTVNGDTLVEPHETFFVSLTNVSGATVSDGQGQGTIQNDDAANLVITQIYPGGNNAGATYRNDFIEIFNRGTTTINFSVTPYSVQYAGATAAFGAANTKTDLTHGIIGPGQYFLIQEAGGTTNGVVLPAPDATGNIAMAATGGKIALVLGTTPVAATSCPGDDAAPPTNPGGNNIVDFVAYWSGANTPNCFEGAGAAAFSTSTAGGLDPDARSIIRTVSCTDTNNNSTDFTNPVTAPTARNSTTASAPCP